jgi:hypothetical protein
MIGKWSLFLYRESECVQILMKSILCVFWFSLFSLSAGEPVFKPKGYINPYGPASPYVKEIASKSGADPELLRMLAGMPLEETYEVLMLASGRYGVSRHQDVANDVLFNHPDFENFVQRTVRKMMKSLIPEEPRILTSDGMVDLKAEMDSGGARIARSEDAQISRACWPKMIGLINIQPSAARRIRLAGPCLAGPAYVVEVPGLIEFSPVHQAVDVLAQAISEETGEEIVARNMNWAERVAAAREWWAKNEDKYRWVPPEPRPPAEATPPPKRVPLAAGKQGTKQGTSGAAESGRRGTASPDAEEHHWAWLACIAALVAAGAVIFMRKAK